MPEPLITTIPTAPDITYRIGFLLRELRLARKMLRIAKLADQQRNTSNAQPTIIATPEVAHASA